MAEAAPQDNQQQFAIQRIFLKDVSFEEYSGTELFEIFLKNLGTKIDILSDAKDEIISSFRGNPRDAVVKAEDLKTFVAARKENKISLDVWKSFCKSLGVNPLGLSNSELSIVKILGSRGECSLNNLAGVSGFNKSAIQKDYEMILMKNLVTTTLFKIDLENYMWGTGLN